MTYVNNNMPPQYAISVAVEFNELVCSEISGLDLLGLVIKSSLFILQYGLIIELKATCNQTYPKYFGWVWKGFN